MAKSIYLICDQDGNPFTDHKQKETFLRAWAFKNGNEAEAAKMKHQTVVEFRPVKGK